jgi:phosphoesterase RecJ-like protein
LTERTSDFAKFLQAMQGKRLLHLGHKDADCDALGSAYAMSCILPGDVGFAEGLKDSAQELADWLGVEVIIDPDPSTYDYTIIYDTISPFMLGMPIPARYALFDHHEPGGHRFSNIHSELSDGAEWAWVQAVDSTCSLLVDLFQTHELEINQKAGVALAAGIITDTGRLRLANGWAMQHLSIALKAARMYVEDVLSAIESSERRNKRLLAVLDALRGIEEKTVGDWTILEVETDTHDNGLSVMGVLHQLGNDISIVGFPKNGGAMVMVECLADVVKSSHIDIGQVIKQLGQSIDAQDAWGTPLMGRIIANLPQRQVLDLCSQAVAQALWSNG